MRAKRLLYDQSKPDITEHSTQPTKGYLVYQLQVLYSDRRGYHHITPNHKVAKPFMIYFSIYIILAKTTGQPLGHLTKQNLAFDHERKRVLAVQYLVAFNRG